MTITSDKIGEIELLIDRLKKWQNGDMPRTIKDYSRYSQLIRFVEPQANIVLMGLSAGMPETVRLVHVKLQELLRKASEVDSLKQNDIDLAHLEDSNLLQLARDFVQMLEPIAKKAGQEMSIPDDAEQNLEDTEQDLDDTEQNLDDIEQDIIEALGDKTLTGAKLAKKARHPYNFKFKSSLSGLRKRGILGNKSPGYFLEPEYESLLNKPVKRSRK
jgi:septal ring factor EnvC (AmiA/AmiB activator)